MIKKESRQFNISVEGINCENMYFEHLSKLINNSDRSTYNLKIAPKKMSPLEYAKRNSYKPVERRNGKKLPYIHIQDIEDYYDDYQRTKFYKMIDEMRAAEKKFGVIYQLGYSNYTFELWMLLHAADITHAVQNRHSYLPLINRWFPLPQPLYAVHVQVPDSQTAGLSEESPGDVRQDDDLRSGDIL